MTELAIPNNTQAVVFAPRRLMEWAEEAQAAHTLSEALCQTSFCPEAFRNKPGEATAAILAGAEVGLSPLAALNAYDVIQGRPAPKAITLRALVQSAGHDIWLESATDNCVIMSGRRRGSSNVQHSKWDMKRARDAKLTTKSNWQTQPQNMLTARATSEIARLVGADVILGIPYSSEELLDMVPESGVTMIRSAERPTSVRRKQIAPPVADEPDFDSEPAPPADLRSDAQSKKLFVTARDAGVSNDDLKPFMAEVLGREVESSKTLTKAEAARVIDALEDLITQPGDADPEQTGEVDRPDDGAWPDTAQVQK